MKKRKKSYLTKFKFNFQKAISSSLSSVILFQSCASPTYFSNEPSIVEVNKNLLANKGEAISAIRINFDKDTKRYLMILDKLVQDIVRDPSVAERFANNPEQYIAKNYGIRGLKINLDEYLLKTVLALSNPAISQAIRNNDVKKFLELSLSLDILNMPTETDLDFINKIVADNPELLNVDVIDSSLVAFALAAVVAVTVFTWAAAVTYFDVVVFIQLAVGHKQTVSTKTKSKTKANAKGLYEERDNILLNDTVYQIWSLKDGDISKLYIMNEAYEDMLLTEILNFIEKKYPKQFKEVNIEKTKQLIKLNLKKLK